jgi:tetratricopeptide (TPR) repeat protein
MSSAKRHGAEFLLGLFAIASILSLLSCVKSTRVVGSDNFYVLRNPDQNKSGKRARNLSADKKMQGLSQSIDKTLKAQGANTTRSKTESSNTGLIEEQVPELAQRSAEVKKTPDSAEAHFALASSYHRYRVLDTAYSEYQQAIRLNPSEAKYYESMGRLWKDWGAPTSGIQDVQRALHLNPERGSAWILLGSLYDAQGEFLEAEKAYQRAVDLDPTCFEVHNNLCFMYLQAGEIQKALMQGEEAIRLNPAAQIAHNNLGLAYGLSGDESLAMDQFKLGGDEASAHNNLGLLMMKQKRYTEAMDHFKRASRLKPFNRLAAENYYLAKKLQYEKDTKSGKQVHPGTQEKMLSDPVEKGSVTPTDNVLPLESDPERKVSTQLAPSIPASEMAVPNQPSRVVRFEVLKTSSRDREARRLGDFLHDQGFVLAGVQEDDGREPNRTIVYYRPGYAPAAIDLAHRIPGDQEVLRSTRDFSGADLAILMGRDLLSFLQKLEPTDN